MAQKRAFSTNKVVELFNQSHSTYGSPRIYKKLKARGHNISLNTVVSIMKRNKLNASLGKRRKPSAQYTQDNSLKSPRLFKIENGVPSKPNSILAGDITYISFNNRFLYLSVVIDLFNRKVLGWSLDENLSKDGVMQAFKMAMKSSSSSSSAQIIFHSDQGSQYSSQDFKDLLSKHKVKQSMSRRGNCYDNSIVESFFKTIKSELIWRRNFESKKELKLSIYNYIELWYNQERLHSSLDYMSPLEYQLSTQKAA